MMVNKWLTNGQQVFKLVSFQQSGALQIGQRNEDTISGIVYQRLSSRMLC